MKKTKEFLMVKEAAEILGISDGTLRKWGREGRIRVARHPISRYRLYRLEDVNRLLDKISKSLSEQVRK